MPGIPGEQKIQIRWMHQGTEGERVVRSMDVYPFFFIQRIELCLFLQYNLTRI